MIPKLSNVLILFDLVAAAMTGCVVAPAGYYGPRVAAGAPARVVVVRPYR